MSEKLTTKVAIPTEAVSKEALIPELRSMLNLLRTGATTVSIWFDSADAAGAFERDVNAAAHRQNSIKAEQEKLQQKADRNDSLPLL